MDFHTIDEYGGHVLQRKETTKVKHNMSPHYNFPEDVTVQFV